MVVNHRILTAQGDQGLVAEGTAIYTCPVDLYDKTSNTSPNVAVGQLAIWDPETGLALDETNIASVDDIVISVNYGGRLGLRHISGDELIGQALNYANVNDTVSGTPPIKAFLFNCTECAESYSVTVTVDDHKSRNEQVKPKDFKYTFTVHTACEGCADCPGDQSNGADIACKIRDYANGKPVPDATCVVNSGHHVDAKDYPFTALKLYDVANSFKTFCLASAGNCTGLVDGIGELAFTHPVNGATTVDFSAYVNDDDYSTYDQIKTVAALMQQSLGKYGDVAVTKGAGPNGQIQLIISSCLTDIVLDDPDGSPIAVCSQVNLLDPVTVTDFCPDCSGPDNTKEYSNGVAFVAKEVELDCDTCDLPETVLGYLGRDIDVYATGDGWRNDSTTTLTVQSMVLPRATGYELREKEWAQDRGGLNRGQYPWNDHLGRHGTLSKDSRSNIANIRTLCCSDYCVYAFGHKAISSGGSALSRGLHSAQDLSQVLIESDASTTIAAFQTVMNAWLAARYHQNFIALNCSSGIDTNGKIY